MSVEERQFPTWSDPEAESARSLVQHLFRDVTSLAALEVQLTRLELEDKVASVAKTAGQAATAGVFGLVALLCLSLAIVAALASYLPLWAAALIVAAVAALVALVLVGSARTGMTRMKAFSGAHTARRVLRPPAPCESIGEVESRIVFTRARIEESLLALEHKTDLLPPLRDTALSVGSLGVTVAAILRQTKEQPH